MPRSSPRRGRGTARRKTRQSGRKLDARPGRQEKRSRKPRQWLVRLTTNEKWGGYGAAVIAATSFLVLWVPNVGRHAAAGPGGAFFLVEGIALSALLVLATASGRREAFAAALLLIAAGPWGPEALFQVLFLAAALWQGYVSLAARRQRDQRDRPTRGTGVSDRS